MLLFSNQVFAVPTTMAQQGRLLDSNGHPVQGSQFDISIVRKSFVNNSIMDRRAVCIFENGFYNVILGDDNSNPLDTIF